MDSIPRCILLIILIIVGGFFSAAETAYSYCNKTRMKTMAGDGDKAAKRVCWIVNEYDRTIITLLILINVIHILAAVESAILFEKWLGGVGAVVSTVVLTLLMFIVSETIPKNIAKANCDSIAIAFSYPVKYLCLILKPISIVFLKLSEAVKKLFSKDDKTPTLTEDEFSDMIDDVVESDDGVLEPEEGKIIQSAIEFGDTTVDEVMTKIEDVRAIEYGINMERAKDEILDCNYSRMPIYKGSIDNIIGVLQTDKFLQACVDGNYPCSLRQFMTTPFRIGLDKHIDDVFSEMTKKRNHFSIVIDENGRTVGIVTMDDILEEIVGEEVLDAGEEDDNDDC